MNAWKSRRCHFFRAQWQTSWLPLPNWSVKLHCPWLYLFGINICTLLFISLNCKPKVHSTTAPTNNIASWFSRSCCMITATTNQTFGQLKALENWHSLCTEIDIYLLKKTSVYFKFLIYQSYLKVRNLKSCLEQNIKNVSCHNRMDSQVIRQNTHSTKLGARFTKKSSLTYSYRLCKRSEKSAGEPENCGKHSTLSPHNITHYVATQQDSRFDFLAFQGCPNCASDVWKPAELWTNWSWCNEKVAFIITEDLKGIRAVLVKVGVHEGKKLPGYHMFDFKVPNSSFNVKMAHIPWHTPGLSSKKDGKPLTYSHFKGTCAGGSWWYMTSGFNTTKYFPTPRQLFNFTRKKKTFFFPLLIFIY